MMSTMIWTVIFKTKEEIRSTILDGPHGSSNAIAFVESKVEGEILAIIAGRHSIHFK